MPNAFNEDFFERVVNVQWSESKFSFAGYNQLDKIIQLSSGAQYTEVHFTELGAASSDGKTWNANKVERRYAFFGCVRGKVEDRYLTIAYGDILMGPHDSGPGFVPSYGNEPAAGVSYDDGATWSDAGIPLQQWIYSEPDPDTGKPGEVAVGTCQAVAYDPNTQTFYVGAWMIFSMINDTYWEDQLYSGNGSGFAQLYSERRELFAPFEGFRWPDVDMDVPGNKKLLVSDQTGTTKPGRGIQFAVSFANNQHVPYTATNDEKTYVKCNDGVAYVGDGALSPPTPLVYSITAGSGKIIVVGAEDEDETAGPVTYVSDDDGVSWTKVLEEFRYEIPPPEVPDSGSFGGSCSYSNNKDISKS